MMFLLRVNALFMALLLVQCTVNALWSNVGELRMTQGPRIPYEILQTHSFAKRLAKRVKECVLEKGMMSDQSLT